MSCVWQNAVRYGVVWCGVCVPVCSGAVRCGVLSSLVSGAVLSAVVYGVSQVHVKSLHFICSWSPSPFSQYLYPFKVQMGPLDLTSQIFGNGIFGNLHRSR